MLNYLCTYVLNVLYKKPVNAGNELINVIKETLKTVECARIVDSYISFKIIVGKIIYIRQGFVIIYGPLDGRFATFISI